LTILYRVNLEVGLGRWSTSSFAGDLYAREARKGAAQRPRGRREADLGQLGSRLDGGADDLGP
jgi:hypothetical protein